MRAAKWIVIVLFALAALLAAGALALTQLVDPNRFKDDIERSVSNATGRKLALQGDIELDFFPWLALETGTGSLGNPSGFDGEPFLSWQQARIAARLVPLLRSELVVDRIQFSGARVSLEKLADGRANWDGWGVRQSAGNGATNNPVDVAGIELRDSRLRYLDRGAEFELSFDRWQLKTGAIRTGVPIDLETRFAAAVKGIDGVADLTLRTRYVPGATLKLENTWLEGALSGAALGVEKLPVQLTAAAVAVTSAARRVAVEQWAAKVGLFVASGAARGTWGKGGSWTSKLDLKTEDLRAALAQLKVQAPATRDARAFGRYSLTTDFTYDTAGLTTQALTTSLDDTTLSGELKLGPAAPRLIEFALAGDRIDLTRYLEPEDAVTEPFVLPTAALRAIQARGTLSLAEATLAETKMKRVRIQLLLDERGLRSVPPPS